MVLASLDGERKSRACGPLKEKSSALGLREETFAFTTPMGLDSPMTRAHDRLLGPCFKTGRVNHRPIRR